MLFQIKNAGYNIVLKIYKILSGEVENLEGLPEDMTNDDLAYFNYAPNYFCRR